MISKNACDVLAVIATNNLITKEAAGVLPALRTISRGAKLAGRGFGQLPKAVGNAAVGGVKAAGNKVAQVGKNAAGKVRGAATAAGKRVADTALDVYTNPTLTNASRAAKRSLIRGAKPAATAVGLGSAYELGKHIVNGDDEE